MADETPKPIAPISKTTRPMSEALLNEKVRQLVHWRVMGEICPITECFSGLHLFDFSITIRIAPKSSNMRIC